MKTRNVAARIASLLIAADLPLEAATFIRRQLMSSRQLPPTAQVAAWMRANLTTGKALALYRGVSLGRATSQQMREAAALSSGDPAPPWLSGANADSGVLHCTTSESVARYYGREGDVSAVMAMAAPASVILFDYRMFSSLSAECWGDADDYADTATYLKREREVFVDRSARLVVTLVNVAVHGRISRAR